MTRTLLGPAVQRSEDPTLLTGEARFLADIAADGAFHVAFVRSPLAHGSVTNIDVSAAIDRPGVHGVWTAGDLDIPPQAAFGGEAALARPVLATDRVRFV